MHERDLIFRERLVTTLSELNSGAGKERDLRQLVGTYVRRLVAEAGAHGWRDLKERADGGTYDSMLKLFTEQSEAAARKGDAKAVRAFEVLALSLIARRQYQADLQPGVAFLDNYVEECADFVKRNGTITVVPKPKSH